MYVYFIDDYTYEKKYRREMDRLDLLLTQHGLTGKKIKLSRLSDLEARIKEAAFSGSKTFVAVGNDMTASQLLNTLIKLRDTTDIVVADEKDADSLVRHPQAGMCLAILPIGQEKQDMASALGYPKLIDAVSALKRRRTTIIDLGSLNHRHYFITKACFGSKVALGFSNYSVSSLRSEHEVIVGNTSIFNQKRASATDICNFNPRDGHLEAVITYTESESGFSHLFSSRTPRRKISLECLFQITKITILSPRKIINVMADVAKQFSTPVKVEVVPQVLRVVVGEGFRG
jgi:diacylglycerol kinase family enzyme